MRIWKERNFLPNSQLISLIYSQSKINLSDYYETCAIMSSESSNNQQIIDNLEYYVFNNLMVYYQKIAENKSGTNGNEQQNTQNQAANQFSNAQKSVKQLMKPNLGSRNFKKK